MDLFQFFCICSVFLCDWFWHKYLGRFLEVFRRSSLSLSLSSSSFLLPSLSHFSYTFLFLKHWSIKPPQEQFLVDPEHFQTLKCAHVCLWVYVRAHVCVSVWMYVCSCVCMCVLMWMYVCVLMCVYMCVLSEFKEQSVGVASSFYWVNPRLSSGLQIWLSVPFPSEPSQHLDVSCLCIYMCVSQGHNC